jgi:hypothetical protein
VRVRSIATVFRRRRYITKPRVARNTTWNPGSIFDSVIDTLWERVGMRAYSAKLSRIVNPL